MIWDRVLSGMSALTCVKPYINVNWPLAMWMWMIMQFSAMSDSILTTSSCVSPFQLWWFDGLQWLLWCVPVSKGIRISVCCPINEYKTRFAYHWLLQSRCLCLWFIWSFEHTLNERRIQLIDRDFDSDCLWPLICLLNDDSRSSMW